MAAQGIQSGAASFVALPAVDRKPDRMYKTKVGESMLAHDWLEASVTQRTRELMAAFEVSQEIVAQLDLEHVLNSVAEQARALLNARAALLCLLTPEESTLQLVAHSGKVQGELSLHPPTHCEPALHIADNCHTIIAPTDCMACSVVRQTGPGHCAAALLRSGKTTLGALCVVREQEAPFDHDQTRSLMLLANAAAIAITNARLAVQARQEAARVAACTEREQLAAELHDHLAQTLGFLNLKADRLQALLAAEQMAEPANELAQMKAAIATAYAQVRTALTGLQQPSSNAQDLVQKLTTSVAEFRDHTGLPTELVIADSTALALPEPTQTQLLHIIREALTNIRRHAHAHSVQVRVERSQQLACFTIEDDGRGFEPSGERSDHHLGLTIMRTRAERSGGQLQITSTPGHGAQIVVCFPLQTLIAGQKDD
ncbi:MAG: ATP-binding protein [Caldilineaceae bacterium]